MSPWGSLNLVHRWHDTLWFPVKLIFSTSKIRCCVRGRMWTMQLSASSSALMAICGLIGTRGLARCCAGRERCCATGCLCSCSSIRKNFLFLESRSAPIRRALLYRHNDTDKELVNATCPSIATEDLISLLEYSVTQLGGRTSANLQSMYGFHKTTFLLLGDIK